MERLNVITKDNMEFIEEGIRILENSGRREEARFIRIAYEGLTVCVNELFEATKSYERICQGLDDISRLAIKQIKKCSRESYLRGVICGYVGRILKERRADENGTSFYNLIDKILFLIPDNHEEHSETVLQISENETERYIDSLRKYQQLFGLEKVTESS